MKKTILIIAALCVIGIVLFKTLGMKHENPFFSEYNTPFNIPPFDKIENSDYIPAFEEGIKQHNEEIEAICNNKALPDFENTIVALDNAGQLLENVTYAFNGVYETISTPELQEIGSKVFPMMAAHSDAINLNERLFERIKQVYDNQAKFNLNKAQTRLLEKYYNEFVRNGALLSAEKKEELKQINEKLASLNLKFGDNIVNDTNKWKMVIEKEEDLAGLPESSIAVAAEEAEAAGMKGKWVFTLHSPSRLPFLTYADNRDLRKEMYLAYTNLANNNDENDNKQLINEILKLRSQKAQLFGFENYAAYQIAPVMAKTVKNAEDLLMQIWAPAVKKAHEEIVDMQKYVDNHGGNFKIEAWDYYYYAEKVKKERFEFDENDVRAYFPIDNVRKGIFTLAERLYGLTFKEVTDVPVYHPDVKVFEVFDKDNKHLATFMTDYYARAGKRQGAWMFVYQEANGTKGVRPIVYNVGNFSKPTADNPSLLTLDDVETMFHEFGHGLHGMLTKTQYKGNAGTNVDRDFVEFPSQLNEHWMLEPELLKVYAHHYKTGEVIPEHLVQKLVNSSKFNQGFMMTELVGAALLDLEWHKQIVTEDLDVAAFEQQVAEKLGMPKEIQFRYRSTYFNHIFSGDGYAAGYYTYLWAQVLDCDGYEVFMKNGIFDPETAAKYKTLLESGNDEDPMVLYENFAGHQPEVGALLRDKGLDE